ncbi:hypothetical protein ACMXYQ_05920 [Neptuniibacter sp. PT34_22]|uniref:hypothetical protein n=1 Tax=Neptuniibacter sp. PT34_22 TaxID=3398205 RepID=UPI0039F4DD60
MSLFLKVAAKFFPPLALISVRGKIKGVPDAFKEEIEDSINSIEEKNTKNVFEWAKFIYESEIARKDTIESKAQSYLMGLSVSIGIIAAIPFLFSSRWSLPTWVGVSVAILFTVAIIFMLVAGYYALKTRQGGAMSLLGADLFKSQLKDNKIGFTDNSTLLIFYAKNNEKLLIEKSNYLYVAEMCFVRAIGIISISILLAVGSKFYQSIFNTNSATVTDIRTKSNKCPSFQSEIKGLQSDIEIAKLGLNLAKNELEDLKGKSLLIDQQISTLKHSSTKCHE